MQAYVGGVGAAPSPYAAPARARDLSGLPPAYVATAELDPLRDEGIEYAVRLQRSGVPTELHHYARAFHVFSSVAFGTVLGDRALADHLGALGTALKQRQR